MSVASIAQAPLIVDHLSARLDNFQLDDISFSIEPVKSQRYSAITELGRRPLSA